MAKENLPSSRVPGANTTLPSLPTIGQTPAAAPTSGGGNWFTRLSPEMQAAMVTGGTGILGGVISGIGQGKQNNENNAFQAQENAADRELRRMQLALQATQGDPFAVQKARQRMAIMGALLPGMKNASVSSNIPGMNMFIPQVSGGLQIPEGGFGPEVQKQFSPEAINQAEAEYWARTQGALDPGAGQSARGTAIQRALGPTQPAPKGYEWKLGKNGQYELKKKGGGFWGTLGKIGTIAGLGVGTALTGGLLAPALGSTLAGITAGAGFGALGGALGGGGVKGALTGAAMGGATGGLFGGGAAKAGGEVFKQGGIGALAKSAGKAAISPRGITQAVGGALPGPTGQLISLGGAALPGSLDWSDILRRTRRPGEITPGNTGIAGRPTGAPSVSPSGILASLPSPLDQGMITGYAGGRFGPTYRDVLNGRY